MTLALVLLLVEDIVEMSFVIGKGYVDQKKPVISVFKIVVFVFLMVGKSAVLELVRMVRLIGFIVLLVVMILIRLVMKPLLVSGRRKTVIRAVLIGEILAVVVVLPAIQEQDLVVVPVGPAVPEGVIVA